MTKYGGRARHDISWTIGGGGEILVKGERPGVLFSGYGREGALGTGSDSGGWFHTGDLGRKDADGNLIFIERSTEAIRVKGEYIPISYLEERFAKMPGVEDLAIWRRPSSLGEDEVVLFLVVDQIPVGAITDIVKTLPLFMRPSAVARVEEIEHDPGVGKIRRRELSVGKAIEVLEI